MKFTTGIFFFILISVCYVSNAQKAFDQVRALLSNLKQQNVKDQAQADVREKNERAWCQREIARAVALLARRQHDVDSLKAHITFLIKTRAEARHDRATRIARIKANLALLAKFKKQRCDNNLIFVKQLREHMQAVRVMTLLRGDIVAYFNAKPVGQRGVFIEKFEQYINLLDEEHKQVFVQLKNEMLSLRPHVLDRNAETQIGTRRNKDINAQGDRLTAQRSRTVKQIGTGHVDNKRGALKRLATPGWEKIGAFNAKARAKILGMIDGLINHLRASRRKLTRDEIHAAEDFAIFQNSMFAENKYLKKKIAELTKEITSLTNQIRVSRVQLVKRRALRDQARRALNLLRKMCEEKYAYFKNETARRIRENKYIDQAIKIFSHLTGKLSARVRSRASDLTTSNKFTNNLNAHVVKSERSVESNLAGRQKVRRAVVF